MLTLSRTLRSGTLAAALVAVGATGALGAAGSPAATPATAQVVLTIDCSAFAAVPAQADGIQLGVGGVLVVTLCSNASTGYSWSDPTISDASVLSTFAMPAEPAASMLPGAAGTQSFGFRAETAGSASVQISYDQPWSGGQKDVWTLSLDITVAPGPGAQTDINVGCDTFGTAPKQTASASVAVGDELTVTLCSNASTGFSWGDPTISDPTVLTLTRQGVVPPSSPMPGAPGSQVWSFSAITAGTAHVHSGYSQPWSGGQKDIWTFDLDVTVG
jgi:inhibitor of cysteine peptidase